MGLDTSGNILEGAKVSPSNSVYSFPPRTIVSTAQQAAFNGLSTRREYCVWLSCNGASGFTIENPDLRVNWTKNDQTNRFSWDASSRKWLPNPGSSPKVLGRATNAPRLKGEIPMEGGTASLYFGTPRVSPKLQILVVNAASEFANELPKGQVQIARDTKELNFSRFDMSDPAYAGSSVCLTSDSFFDRASNDGSVKSYPQEGVFDAYLNPIPPVGSIPRLRLGFGQYLDIVNVGLDSQVYEPASGTAVVSYESGYVRLSSNDASSKTLYYDGISQGQSSLTRTTIGTINTAESVSLVGTQSFLVGVSEEDQENVRYVAYAGGTEAYFLNIKYAKSDPIAISSGSVWVNTTNGKVFVSAFDATRLVGRTLIIIDTYADIDGVSSMALRRSGLNGIGVSSESDFHECYNFPDETVVSSLKYGSFISIPTRPVDDQSLSYRVGPGTGSTGTYVGSLNRVSESGISGICWDLDFKSRQITLYDRTDVSVSVDKPTDTILLPHQVINSVGFSYSINGGIPNDVSESADLSAGQISFQRSFGESSESTYSSGIGFISNQRFVSNLASFSENDLNRSLVIYSGTQSGVYQIISLADSRSLRCNANLNNESNLSFEIRDSVEYLVEHVWRPDPSPIKNFTVSVADSIGGDFSIISEKDYRITGNTVLFTKPPSPNKVVRIDYQYLDVVGGVQIISNATQYYTTEIVNETGTLTSEILVGINPSANTIAEDKTVTVTLNGSTLDESAFRTDFSNNRIILLEPASESDLITVSYSIYEYDPTDRVIILDNVNVYLDTTKFSSGSSQIAISGDASSSIPVGSFVKVAEDVYEVSSSTFNAESQITDVSFTTAIRADYQGDYLTSDVISFTTTFNAIESLYVNDIELSLPGLHSIASESLLKISNLGQLTPEVYSVSNASYDASLDRTTVSLSRSAVRTYIAPIVSYSTSPIYTSPSRVSTKNSLIASNPFTVFRVGKNPKRFVLDEDFSIKDGGQIDLISPVLYGDKLVISYSARYILEPGSKVTASYYRKIVPTAENGLLGQDLISSYKVYWPDDYYFRIETVQSYIPDLTKEIKSDPSQSSTSGPISSFSVTSLNSDQGIPSLYFDEQKYRNLDVVTRRVLSYYNDVTNLYEDILSNYDGRIVGGHDGRFLYDGSDGQVRQSESSVTNQIDDTIFLGSFWSWSSFSMKDSYRTLYSPSRFSRLFPTNSSVNVLVNADVGPDNNGKIIGNLGRTSITKFRSVYSAVATCRFSTTSSYILTCSYEDNDAQDLTPSFRAGMDVKIYDRYGTFQGVNRVVSVSSEPKPLTLTMLFTVNISVGSLVSNNLSNNTINRFYKPETDVELDEDTGDLINTESTFLQALNIQRPVTGNEILTTNVSFSYSDSAPHRFPALDGLINDDSGLLPAPILHRENLSEIINEEQRYFNGATWKLSGSVTANYIVTVSTPSFGSIGKVYRFDDGPNSNTTFFVNAVNGNAYSVNQPLVQDNTVRVFRDISAANDIKLIINKYAPILISNQKSSSGALGILDSQIRTFENLNYEIGMEVGSYSGSLLGNGVLLGTNPATFPDPTSHYVFIPSGPNCGAYPYIKTSNSQATLDDLKGQAQFTATDVNFKIMKKNSLWTFDNVRAFGLLGNMTQNFDIQNSGFLSSGTYFDLDRRLTVLTTYLSSWAELLGMIDTVLKNSDALYDRRYLWIKQRTDRKIGLIYKRQYAVNARKESTQKLIETQQKQKSIESL